MSELDRRWRRLVEAARKTPPTEPAPPSPALVDRLARRGLAARAKAAARTGSPEPWAWAAVATFAAASALFLVTARPTLAEQTAALTRELTELPGQVPAAPELPAPFHVPAASEALALLPEGAGLRAALGLPPSPEATP